MAGFNPFSKTKAKIEAEHVENIEEVEEVELMPNDSVEYFEDKLDQLKNRKEKVEFAESKVAIQQFFKRLSDEKAHHAAEQVKLEEQLKSLEVQQKEKAKELFLEPDETKKAKKEKELHQFSVQILTLKARIDVHQNTVSLNDSEENRAELKKLFKNYRAAGTAVNNHAPISAELESIRSVIERIKQIEADLLFELSHSGYTRNDFPLYEQYYKEFADENLIEALRRTETGPTSNSRDYGKELFEDWLLVGTNISFEAYLNAKLGN